MPGFSPEEIEMSARQELAAEAHREAVEAAKVRMRAEDNRPWWRKVFPYRIKLERL